MPRLCWSDTAPPALPGGRAGKGRESAGEGGPSSGKGRKYGKKKGRAELAGWVMRGLWKGPRARPWTNPGVTGVAVTADGDQKPKAGYWLSSGFRKAAGCLGPFVPAGLGEEAGEEVGTEKQEHSCPRALTAPSARETL